MTLETVIQKLGYSFYHISCCLYYRRVIRVGSADEFYMKMGELTCELERGDVITCDEIVQSVYSMAPIPLPKLAELREKFMYDITPFNAAVNSADGQSTRHDDSGNSSDDYHNDMDNLTGDAIFGCFNA